MQIYCFETLFEYSQTISQNQGKIEHAESFGTIGIQQMPVHQTSFPSCREIKFDNNPDFYNCTVRVL